MPYKIIEKAEQPRQFCDYIENKLAIAREHNTKYEWSDEDKRIQELYDNPNLKPVDKITSIARVKTMEDGSECIVVAKNVVFYDKLSKIERNRYTTKEGVTEIPMRTINENGEEESSQIRLIYSIPFSKEKVLEYVRKAGARKVNFKYYYGPETGNKQASESMIVGNKEMFLNATWDELQLAREKKYVSSMLNRLPEIRNENNESVTATITTPNPTEAVNNIENTINTGSVTDEGQPEQGIKKPRFTKSKESNIPLSNN